MRAIPLIAAVVTALCLAAPAYAGPKVAVVDMVQVIEKHQGSQAIDRNATKAKQEAQAELKRQEERLTKLKQELDTLDENDPSRPLKEKQYLTQANTMKFNHEWALKMAEDRYVKDLERLYKAIQALVAAHARDNGIEIVLLREDPNQPFNATGVQDFALKSRLRRVIYAASTVDITDAVIARIPENERVK